MQNEINGLNLELKRKESHIDSNSSDKERIMNRLRAEEGKSLCCRKF